MQHRIKFLCLLGCFFFSHCCYAAYLSDTGNAVSLWFHQFFAEYPFRPLIGLNTGIAISQPGVGQTYIDSDSETFIFYPDSTHHTNVLIGGFLAAEFPVAENTAHLQLGLEYDYVPDYDVNGDNSVGIQNANTATLYRYRYQIESNQLFAQAKLLWDWRIIYHPYIEGGLGIGMNESENFSVSTQENCNINLPATFTDHDNASFSFNLGIGLDVDITPTLRIGGGYRFTDFGRSFLGNGQVEFGNYVAPTSFTVSQSHLIADELSARVTYYF